MGQLLKLIEIRRSSGILLIARRGTFPTVMLRASDDQRRDSTIRTLAQDKPAIMQLRAQWQNVFPARAPESFTPIELVRMVQRELGARSVEAVLLRTPKMPLSPAELANIPPAQSMSARTSAACQRRDKNGPGTGLKWGQLV